MPLVLLLLFIVIPILEIATFIQVGSLIGLLPTLVGILLTAIVGIFLVRQQGLKTLNEAQSANARGELPVGPLFHGVFILIAGLLLLTPGFVTDAIGFIFLIPPLRSLIGAKIWSAVKDNVEIRTVGGHYPGPDGPRGNHDQGPIIDGEATDISEDSGQNSKSSTNSPWKNINHTR